MKKLVKNIFRLASVSALLLIGACEEGETVFDEIIDNETRGART